MTVRILHGDVLEHLATLEDNSFDACCTDPPYGYSFMGKRWDYDVPSVEVWRAILRVLKPGAPLLSFGGSRTFHRIATGIEDAGFELRDTLMWLYAKGFPKSLDVGKALDKAAGAEREVVGTRVLTGNAAIPTKEKGGTYGVQVGSIPPKTIPVTAPATDLAKLWDGYGTSLKPAHEPIILARKPLDGTVAANVTKWGVGGLAIDACRIHSGPSIGGSISGVTALGQGSGWNKHNNRTTQIDRSMAKGRWPANVLLDEEAGQHLDETVGNRPSRPSVTRNGGGNQGGALFTERKGKAKPDSGYSENGGPSRFFFSAKVSTRERELGCSALPKKSAGEMTDREDETAGLDSPRSGAGRGGGAHNHHPTLKPVALTRYLAQLVLPPTEAPKLLVPYSGAGSEMIGAYLAGWQYIIGVEQDADYVAIAKARIEHAMAHPEDYQPKR